MFVRADTLLRSGDLGPGRHVIHFGWEDFQPTLLACELNSNNLSNVALKGHIDWTVSENKRCVGSFEEDGYHRCPEAMPVRKFDQCNQCASSWIGRQDCVFEPQCEGGLCDSPICSREHTVYLAFFGETGKIGMTTSRRLKERGIEQGADAIVPLARFPNRLKARRAEQETAERLRLTQLVRRKKAVQLLRSRPDMTHLEKMFHGFEQTLTGRLDLVNEPLLILNEYPLATVEEKDIELVESNGRHRGKLLGLKGKFLVYDDGAATMKALDASDLPGRFLAAKRF
jgi:hypothetical protein